MDNKDELIAKLERENAYLKSLLEQNGISYGEPKEIEQHNFSGDEKINLYLSYFVGRIAFYNTNCIINQDKNHAVSGNMLSEYNLLIMTYTCPI